MPIGLEIYVCKLKSVTILIDRSFLHLFDFEDSDLGQLLGQTLALAEDHCKSKYMYNL